VASISGDGYASTIQHRPGTARTPTNETNGTAIVDAAPELGGLRRPPSGRSLHHPHAQFHHLPDARLSASRELLSHDAKGT
jgi:hypothetical protein